MFTDLRLMAAATIASGLVSKHGVDHGGVEAEVIAGRSLAIADAILSKIEGEFSQSQEAPSPLGDPGDAGSQTPELKPVPPTADPSAAEE